MKTIIALLIVLFALWCPTFINADSNEDFSLEELLNALAWKESRYNSQKVGDRGKAVGMYQIHKRYVNDVNRILRLTGERNNFYTYDDRWNASRSRSMVRIYIIYWDKRSHTIEAKARIHNGGPRGERKKKTLAYWYDIRKILYEQRKQSQKQKQKTKR